MEESKMTVFTWTTEKIVPGIRIVEDAKLGKIVFLGEEGRNRRYEKISLDRHTPPEIAGERIMEATLCKIVLPAKAGKSEKTFFVLKKPQGKNDGRIFVRINTYTGYVRNASGRFETVEGNPETMVSGYGAFGDAGRIGNWDDAIVAMGPGDVLRIYPSRREHSFALWIENGQPQTAVWKDYENIRAVAAMCADRENADIVFGNMPAYSFRGGEISRGIKAERGAAGIVVKLGEEGRGRVLTEVPLVSSENPSCLLEAAVVKLSEKEIPSRYSDGQPQIKTAYGLTAGEKKEENAFLVHIDTSGPYTRDTTGEIIVKRGNPTVLASGEGAHGDAGRIGGWTDTLVVLKKGEVLLVRQEGGYKSAGPWAIYIEEDQVKCQQWQYWKLQDGRENPDLYLQDNLATVQNVPPSWFGRVVSLLKISKGQRGCGPEKPEIEEDAMGELVGIENGVVINSGWEKGDTCLTRILNVSWLHLEEDKEVHRFTEEEAAERKDLHQMVSSLKKEIYGLLNAETSKCLSDRYRGYLEDYHGKGEFRLMSSEDILSWISNCRMLIDEAKKEIGDKEIAEEKKVEGFGMGANPMIKLRVAEKGKRF